MSYLGIPLTASERSLERWKHRRSRLNPLRILGKVFNVWRYGKRAAAAARDFDIIYLHNEPNILGCIKLRPGQRLILHMHNDHLSIPAFRPWYRRTLAKASRVVFVSDYLRNSALRHFPEYRDRFTCMLNATDTDMFQPPGNVGAAAAAPASLAPGFQYVLYAGRLIPEKGVDVLVRAFQHVVAGNPQARLIITGSSFFAGARRTAFEDQLARLAEPIGQSIEFTGFVPRERLRSLYRDCDLVVVPSVWQEPSGLVVLEAMASGKCLVATAVGGIPELVTDGRTGVLVAPADPAALARAITGLLADPERRAALGSAARDHLLAPH